MNSKGFIAWLGFENAPNLSKSKPLGRFLGFILSLFAITYIILCAYLTVEVARAAFRIAPYSSETDGVALRNIGLVFAAFVSAPFLVWRTNSAAKQARISEETLFNQRFEAASNNLAARRETSSVATENEKTIVVREIEDDLVLRATSIDTLEGLSSERKDVAPRVVRLLASYVRSNFTASNLENSEGLERYRVPRLDLQSAVDVMGRLLKLAAEVDSSNWRLNLKGCNFDGVQFRGESFQAVDFSGSRFEGARFFNVNLDGAIFAQCLLSRVDFHSSSLKGARFNYCILNRPEVPAGGWYSPFDGAMLYGADFSGADLSAVTFLGEPKDIENTFGNGDTITRWDIGVPTKEDLKLLQRSLRHRLTTDQLVHVDEVKKSGFQNWSPFGDNDIVTGVQRKEHYERLNLNEFPYIGW
ncbi:MAG: pentapeptide repeat-containing protein [Pseudomonadota bacterium]